MIITMKQTDKKIGVRRTLPLL